MDATRIVPGRRFVRKMAIAVAMAGPAIGSLTFPSDLTVLATTESAFGCEVESQKPEVQDGEMVGRATIQCAEALTGRTVRVEVWQKDGDDNWQPLSDSVSDWLGMEEAGVSQRIDGGGFWCQKLDGDRTRKYQTRVFVGDGAGHESQIASNPQDLGRNCLAESAAIDPDLPEPPDDSDSGVSPATKPSVEREMVNCSATIYNAVANGNSVDPRVDFKCIPLSNSRETRTILVSNQQNVNGPWRNVRFLLWTQKGPTDLTRFTLIPYCNRVSTQTSKFRT
jgi:hypothetical protein